MCRILGYWLRIAILAALVGLLFAATPTLGQAKTEVAKQEGANVSLRFVKEGTASSSCSATLGIITQSMLQVEGVKNVKMDAKNNAVQVSYDPGKTTPQKIVAASNKENTDTLLQLPDAKQSK
jgi:copper chaperone CopZ